MLAIGVGLLIAFNISNEKWLWDTDNIKVGIDYLFGPEKDVEYKVKIPKKEKGKNWKVIVCAIMRKLVHVIFGVLKSGEKYDPNYKPIYA